MTRLRLLPIVLFALGCLLALKVLDLTSGRIGGPAAALASESAHGAPAEENEPGEAKAADIKSVDPKPVDPKDAGPVVLEQPLIAPDSYSPSERALLTRLQQRRESLDRRGQDLDTREGLISAAEKRVEDRIAELKRLQASLDAQDSRRGDADAARLKSVVVMYESMKAKDAARVFNGLDMPVLIGVVTAMKPQKVSDILAAMDAAVAQRLTVALATRQPPAAVPSSKSALDLPQIQGTTPAPKG